MGEGLSGNRPFLIVIAGPNGAGKSTAAPPVLRGALGVAEFVNADTIARGLSAFEPERAAISAGKIMLRRLHELANARESFAFETTLASRSFAPWIRELTQSGYGFHLIIFWLPTPQMAIFRVRERVRMGGHDVPDERVERRYFAGIRNFFELYQPPANSWRVYNNAERSGALLIASGGTGRNEKIYRAKEWKAIKSLTANRDLPAH